jgi:hypothetical protein
MHARASLATLQAVQGRNLAIQENQAVAATVVFRIAGVEPPTGPEKGPVFEALLLSRHMRGKIIAQVPGSCRITAIREVPAVHTPAWR